MPLRGRQRPLRSPGAYPAQSHETRQDGFLPLAPATHPSRQLGALAQAGRTLGLTSLPHPALRATPAGGPQAAARLHLTFRVGAGLTMPNSVVLSRADAVRRPVHLSRAYASSVAIHALFEVG